MRNGETSRCRFEVHPRSLAPEITDMSWLQNPESPKTRILSACFSDAAAAKVLTLLSAACGCFLMGLQLMIVVRRDKYGKASDCGIGIQSCDLSALGQGATAAVNAAGGGFGPWYQV